MEGKLPGCVPHICAASGPAYGACILQLYRHLWCTSKLAHRGCDGPFLPGLQAVAFGMGGGLLQRVNRDTMSFGELC